ncbi:MAG: M20/M25/M40 family metallo-hydrolase [Chitinophagaceae bacterium]
MKFLTAVVLMTTWCTVVTAQSSVRIQKPDAQVFEEIKREGMNHSQVMKHAFYITDVSGPRLTNSPGYQRAAEWVVSQLKSWGINNARIEPWGEFGKSWQLDKMYLAMSAPYYRPLIAFPKSWTRSVKAVEKAEVLLIDPAIDSVSLLALASKMKGKIIIMGRDEAYKQSFKPDAVRYTEEELAKMGNAVATPRRAPDTAQQRQMRAMMARMGSSANLANKVREMAEKNGAIAILSVNPRGHDGTIFVQGSTRGANHKDSADAFPDIVVATEDYMSICRLAKAGIPVKLDLDLKSTTSKKDVLSYNVIAEIPGHDPKLKDEIVMLGAHLDSWQGSTGATDNASGSSTMIEALRIIHQLGLKPARTIRLALWSGEEQGLLGSQAYVKKTFGDENNPTPAHEKFSCYFNIDNGTGKIRGIYAQGNTTAAEYFKEWLAPFHSLGATTVSLGNTGSTDHISFHNSGLPGFQFIQDPIEYNTRTHHTTMDSYDHLIEDDLKQISTIVAAFVYQAASMEGKMPRK